MSSQIFLKEELERKVKEIERRINEFKKKYGMNFKEFFELTEHGFGKLLEMGFDPDEILRDVSEWEDLEIKLQELKKSK